MSDQEKINDATNRVILAIQRAAMDPETAKKTLAEYPVQVRESWENYFTILLEEEITA